MVEIRKASVAEIFDDKDLPALRKEYAEESAVAGLPEPQGNRPQYEAMESVGALQFFGAYIEGALVGFVAVLAPVMPHYGRMMATTESIFVASAHRKSGAGLALLHKAEEYAREIGSPCIFSSSPVGGRLAKVLPRQGYTETNRVFFKRLA